MASEPQRYLVTGGAGFIGSHIVDALVERGDLVRVLDDLSTGSLDNLDGRLDSIEFVEGSIVDGAAVESVAAGCAGVFHLAAVVSVQQSIHDPATTHRVNALGTLNVIEAARKAGAKVVLSSSAAVYGDEPSLPKREDSPTFPISPYGVQKLMGEYYLRNYGSLHGLGGVALRYFNVYGPRQDPGSPYSGVISIFLDRALAGEALTVFGDGSQTRDFVFVSDVVRANLLAMDAAAPATKVLNVGTGLETSVGKLADAVIEATGSSSRIVHEQARGGDIVRSVCDPSAAQTIGFRAERSLADGLKATAASYRT